MGPLYVQITLTCITVATDGPGKSLADPSSLLEGDIGIKGQKLSLRTDTPLQLTTGEIILA